MRFHGSLGLVALCDISAVGREDRGVGVIEGWMFKV